MDNQSKFIVFESVIFSHFATHILLSYIELTVKQFVFNEKAAFKPNIITIGL